MTEEQEEIKWNIKMSREKLRVLQIIDLPRQWAWELQRYADLLGKVNIRKVENESPEI